MHTLHCWTGNNTGVIIEEPYIMTWKLYKALHSKYLILFSLSKLSRTLNDKHFYSQNALLA